MTNLLAILLSLAMLLTGATAPAAEPVSRTLVVSSLTVRHNDEEVTLSPFAALGVATDGASALFDFFIGSGDDVFLPFQLSADESGLALLAENADVTLKIDREKLDELMRFAPMDEDSAAVFSLMGDYFAAYGQMLKLTQDPDAMQAIQASANAIYDEMVDRGEGVEDSVEYDDETYDVKTYEYDVTAAQLGALTDAIYASNDTLADFAKVYFRLLNALPEDSGLSGFDSFEALLANFDVFTLHVTESIAEEGLNISDIIMTISVPEMETPVELVIHSVKRGDEQSAEVTADVDIGDITMSMYIEGEQSGRDMEMDMTVTLNPVGSGAGAGEESVAETEIIGGEDGPTAIILEADEEDDEEDDDEDEDDEELQIMIDEDELVGGEGDGEDAVYFTVDFDRSYDEDSGNYYQSLSYGLDIAEQKLHAEFAIESEEAECQLTGELDIGEDNYGFELFAEVSDEPIESRIEASEAVSLDEFDPSPLLSSVSEDAMKLYNDESVQRLVAMVQSAMAAASEIEPGAEAIVTEAAEPEDDVLEDVPVSDVEPFVTPQFNWLPQGYEVRDLTVDDEYQNASCMLVNDDTNDGIYVDITGVLAFADSYEHYVLREDGTLEPIDGLILNAEVSENYSVYSVDDGTLNISVYSSGEYLNTEDIAHILAAMSFE